MKSICLLILIILLVGCSKETVKGLDLTNVELVISDLPINFQPLPTESLEKIGFNQGTLVNAYQEAFTTAQAHNFSAYMNPDANQVEIILSVFFSPLSQVEIREWDAQVDNPEQAAYDFSVGIGVDSQTVIKPEFYGVGDKSMGFITNKGGFYMETLLARRNNTVSLLLLMYMNSSHVDLYQLAKVLDQRLVAGYQ